MNSGPTTEKERYLILDALRGLGLAGIALANYPEFALWTFLSAAEQEALPTAAVDKVVRYLQYLVVDGKFYTLFSLLFGVGFSLILQRHSTRLFARRMTVLLLIGLCHLLFIWNGDILLLYAAGGLLLPLFIRLKDKVLLWTAALLILLPVGLDALTQFAGIEFARPFYDAWWAEAARQGINEDNFASWLRDARTYPEMLAFLKQGAIERMWEFVDGHRLPKVVVIFLMGYLIGKHRLYARLEKRPLQRMLLWTSLPGVPGSLLYAWSATHGHCWGLTVHSLLYAVSVIPLALSFVAALCLLYLARPTLSVWQLLAATGRMALTNYIGHSIIGIVLFYGLGFGLGTRFGLIHAEITALCVFLLQIAVSRWWLKHFRFGPLEWIWRMLTYGRFFSLAKEK